ncbi:pyridoxamine 5'-phosphate oxidase family protein [Pengzhenrongella sp.]|jgi:nitroimidazol reductase NimA-like FMN-containing flavoprotein (pyridoxamine 5'-phosphate oxidase superfamily)|uniref:pyridoxamine 5'-phosphate oxidase family protein n=1 Tax=Pengzhenrongella sp. TaxID=2888820 RepID=UPI002F94B716
MDAEQWTVISPNECESLLRQSHLGRIAIVDGDLPLILPVNFVVDDEAEVVFRTNPGSKLDAALHHAPVAFEIDGIDELSQTGWSVLVRGHAHEVTDPREVSRLEHLALVPWAPGGRHHYVRVQPLETTGRRITVPSQPSDFWG